MGQLWYDTVSNNIKSYNGQSWTAVGSNIVGNVSLTGNLFVGPNGFQIQDLGDVSITNKIRGGDISLYANIAGTNTRTLYVNGGTGLVEVAANATANYGVTTKIYVDSEIYRATAGSDTNLKANVAIINANLVSRIDEENQLRANISAANVKISLRDTITRVNSINSAIDAALTANVANINSNLAARVNQTIAVETAMSANVAAANVEISKLRANITAANVEIANIKSSLVQTNTDVSALAPKASPRFTGTPTISGSVPLTGTSNQHIATTEFVQNSITSSGAYWQGSKKYVSTSDPRSSDGADGDFWFKYS